MTAWSLISGTVDEAIGRTHRADPVRDRTGGPAGNARLTAWVGAVLFVLFAIEGVTLLDVRGLITWHFAVGLLLVPPALAKTATTGWRIVRYYRGDRGYRDAGPPPLLLRLLGPLVVVATLAVLGTGVALVLIGPAASRRPLPGGLDAVMLHKATFLVWFAATAPHVLARLLPAVRLMTRPVRAVPGRAWRATVLAVTAVAAGASAALVIGAAGQWHDAPGERHERPPARHVTHW